MSLHNVLLYLLVGLAALALDFIWAEYVSWVGKKNALMASVYATLIYVVGSAITYTFIQNWTVFFPAAIGSFIGTYISVERNSK